MSEPTETAEAPEEVKSDAACECNKEEAPAAEAAAEDPRTGTEESDDGEDDED